MPSETDCLNDALGQIGAARITAIDDGSSNANFCQTFYPALRDGLIRSAHWNFAMTRVELAQDVTAPLFEFAYSYGLPSDLLKVVEYNGANTDTTQLFIFGRQVVSRYRVEGRHLLTNDGTVKLVYLRRVTNPDEWDALFYQVVTTWLASKLAFAITKDERKSSALLTQAINVLLPTALAVDGQENSVEPFRTDELLWGR